MPHGHEFACGTLQSLLGEEVSRLGAQLASYDVLIEAVVAVDAHAVDMRLRALRDAHLQVDGVAHDVHLRGVETVEDVSGVPIVVAHGVLILREAFVEEFLIIDGKLMPAFSTIDGMGDKAAEMLVDAAANGRFLSKDDLRNRSKLSKTLIDTMTDLKIIDDLPQSDQISLFDLIS